MLRELRYDGGEVLVFVRPGRGDHDRVALVNGGVRQCRLDLRPPALNVSMLVNWKAIIVFGLVVAPWQSFATANTLVRARPWTCESPGGADCCSSPHTSSPAALSVVCAGS